MTATPTDGTVYLATDNRWYRWPDPAPYPSRDAAERQARPVSPTWEAAPLDPPTAANSFGSDPFAPPTHWAGAESTEGIGIGRAMLYVAVVLNVIPIAAGVIGYLTLPDSNPGGGCEGIGFFGCYPAPNLERAISAVLALVVTVAATVLAVIVMTVWAGRSAEFRAWPPELKALSILVPYAVVAALGYAAFSLR